LKNSGRAAYRTGHPAAQARYKYAKLHRVDPGDTMSASEADVYLIEAVQSGDQAAWRELIERYQGRLVSFARRMLATPADAEDIVQDTFLGLLRSVDRYDHGRSLETYLFAILRHKLSDQFRKTPKGQRQSLEQIEAADNSESYVDAETPSGRLERVEATQAQRQALVNGLRDWVEQCREQRRFHELIVVEMLVVLGMRNKEVAADLQMPETAVAGVKFRVLDQWRKLAGVENNDWSEADLAGDSTVARIWREEGISCLKRSTLGKYLLGALDDDWSQYVDFHVNQAACDRCRANLDDLREEDERDAAAMRRQTERYFASSVGFLSKRPI
jgi:RNA polymerase sigma factor (sigma-70 family)